MTLATPLDVKTRYPGADAYDDAWIQTLLDEAEVLIRMRIDDLDTLIADGTIDERIVVMVECNAVTRVVRNPEGYKSETEGNYMYERDPRTVSTSITITSDEWRWLGVQNEGMFIIEAVLPYWEVIEELSDHSERGWEPYSPALHKRMPYPQLRNILPRKRRFWT
ncbi:Gp19/Gp15/Gp42 family protein [Amycolatopsis methanolica]|uniref:Gp19/Gp15/Gp42 family protein n=1 Tax=Amycolatopsis methanolica TaxID=1814 RepID=UPI0034268C75